MHHPNFNPCDMFSEISKSLLCYKYLLCPAYFLDIDECKEKRDNCMYKCVNDFGGHHCVCPSGYLLFDQRVCEGI